MANFEVERLEKHQPIKYAITRCYILDGATGVGVGAGLFSELLVRRGCDIFLIDVAERILATAKERVVLAGLERHLLGTHHALRRTSRFCQRRVVMPCYCLDRSITSTWQRNGNRHWQRRHASYIQGPCYTPKA